MNNPYYHPRIKRMRYRSKWRYCGLVLLQFPVYLMWRFSRLVPDDLGRQLRRKFGFLAVPFTSVSDFLLYWVATRPWKMLLNALPLLLMMAWVFSTWFLARNQAKDDLYADYREGLLQAVAKQDYELANFLTGKILGKGIFENDDRLHYAAMIAAHENGNILRRDLLVKRLTEKRNYAPARIWYAEVLLASPKQQGSNLYQAIQQLLSVVEESEHDERTRRRLAQLYFASGRSEKAIEILVNIEDPSPAAMLMLADIYYKVGKKQEMAAVLRKLLADLDMENPGKDLHLAERISANLMLIRVNSDFSRKQREELFEIADLLESQLESGSTDDHLRFLLSACYEGLANEALLYGSSEERIQVMDYLSKAIGVRSYSQTFGKLVYEASNLRSGEGLSAEDMRAGLVMGVGVPMAHVLLGLDSWREGATDELILHFSLAHAHSAGALECVEYVAMHMALSQESVLNPFRFSLERQALWQRSVDLLDCVARVDSGAHDRCLLKKCQILSSWQQWEQLVGLIGDQLAHKDKDLRRRLYYYLIVAHRELGNTVESDKYLNLWNEKINEKGSR